MARPVKRAYDTRRRQAQARETQGHIAEAARALFTDQGYGATSIRDIADAAGVSVQTIYNAFEGGKAAIFHRVMDMTLVGDDEPVPLAERSEYRAMFEAPDPREFLQRGVAMSVALFRRLEPLIPSIRAAVAADPVVGALWRANYGQSRWDGMAEGVGHLAGLGVLRDGLGAARATDIMWTVLSLENYEALVLDRGWSPEEFAAWALDALAATLLGSG